MEVGSNLMPVNKHDHCGCDADQSDWRRGRYEPAEPPESEQGANIRAERGTAQTGNKPRTAARQQR